MVPSPSRRKAVYLAGSALVLGLAGCSTVGTEQSSSTGSESPTPTSISASQETPPATTAPEVTHHYTFSEWHTTERWNGQWQFTVASLSLSTSYETDDDTTYKMPSDRQLLISDAKVRNPSPETKRLGTSLDPAMFAAIANGEAYPERYRIDNSEADWGNIEVDRLENVTNREMRRFSTQGDEVRSDETINIAIVCSISREISRGDLEIGYAENGNAQYPVRWASG